MNAQPIVSVISAFKNSGLGTIGVLDSIRKQHYKNVEHCIVDGASTDNTLKLIESNRSARSLLISRADNSIAEAWNTGVNMASGELITFQGMGDALQSDAIRKVIDLYNSLGQPSKTILVGRCDRINKDGVSLGVSARRYRRIWRPISLRFWFPSCFIPKSLFEEIGLFNENKKIALDCDWLLRAIKHGCQFVYGNHLVRMEEGGVSDTQWLKGYNEYANSLDELGLFNVYDRSVSTLYRAIKTGKF